MTERTLTSKERLLTADEIKRLTEVYRIRGTLNSSLANLMQECAQRGFDKANNPETSDDLLYRIHRELARGHSSAALAVVAAALEHRALPACTACDVVTLAHNAQKANSCVCGEPNSPGTHRTDGPCLAPIGDHHP